MPYDSPWEACRVIFGLLGADADPRGLPFLPELPGRGPAAELTGRAGAMLAELTVDLQPSGWRLTSGEGVDQRRARSLLAQDLDALEEGAGGYTGPLKVQACGPWTLAATLEKTRGGRVLGDPGARRDLAQSLAEGARAHLADVRRRVPGASLVLQVDEPSLPAVLAGRVPTPSGYSRYRPVEEPEAVELLEHVIDAAGEERAVPLVHCCAPGVPVELLCRAGARGIAFDLALVRADDVPALDALAAAVEDGVRLVVGAVPALRPATDEPKATRLAETVRSWWTRLGFETERLLGSCLISPACGLAGADPAWARTALELCRDTSAELAA